MEIFRLDLCEAQTNCIFLVEEDTDLGNCGLSPEESAYVRKSYEQKQRLVFINRLVYWMGFSFPDSEKEGHYLLESFRLDGAEIQKWACRNKIASIVLNDTCGAAQRVNEVAVGIALSNYQFLKYFTETEKKIHSLASLGIVGFSDELINEITTVSEAVYMARDLVNEPVSTLNAPALAEEIKKLALITGLQVEVFDKAKIESLKMGGLLAVNKGSIDPPRFCIISHEPEKAVNEKPLVLVGKGIVYDTGGLSLKPTPDSMDQMKSDMAGAAAVAGLMYAISKLNWPVRVIGLVPATDNRPDGNAYAPGDIIRMHNGLYVEVMNTDAEGRLILADALSYARKYDPGLVIDLATLTGSAAMAVGTIGTVAMGNADQHIFSMLAEAGNNSYERIVQFPLWEEYGKMLDSEFADLKNIGGREAGAITAGKFLQKFTSYTWIHLDIAGPAYLTTGDGYRTAGGTGAGIRLLLEFIRRHYLSDN